MDIQRTRIHLFGNPDIAMDSLPLRMLPELTERFPNIDFRVLDPNEEWEIPDPFIVIDTVVGISKIHIFRGLDEFNASPTVSVHDFDALFQLRYLAKLGKLKRVLIIGIPQTLILNKTNVGHIAEMVGRFDQEFCAAPNDRISE